MPDNPTTSLVKTSQSPALARVSNQLALTDKLLTKSEEPFLIPYRKGNKWGFCDRNKNIVIDCVYDDARAFFDGLAAVRIDSRSLDDKKRARQAKHQINEDYPEDTIGTDMNGWGFVNKKGELIVPCIYSCVWEYSEGYAAVSKDPWLWTCYSLIDKAGKIVPNLSIPAGKFGRLYFSEGMITVRYRGYEAGKVGYYNGYGRNIPFQFSNGNSFSEGLAAVSKDYKWG